jgi:ketosteroid isomerase-like protein
MQLKPLVILLILTAACATAPALTSESVEGASARYAEALKSGTPNDVAAFFAADGELQLPGLDALHGPAAIEAFLAPMASSVVVDICTMQSDLTTVSGRTATEFGHYTQTAGERGKDHRTYTGRFAALWRWDGGRWRIVRLLMQPKP